MAASSAYACLSGGDCAIISEDSCLVAGAMYDGDSTNGAEANCVQPRAGDVNGDGVVNVYDLLLILAAWGICRLKRQAPMWDVTYQNTAS